MAGLAIFPIIFAYGLEPDKVLYLLVCFLFSGICLLVLLLDLFSILLSVAALSSSISLLEPSVAFLSEEKIFSRKSASIILGLIAWFLGIGSLLSFNLWSDKYYWGLELPELNGFLSKSIPNAPRWDVRSDICWLVLINKNY